MPTRMTWMRPMACLTRSPSREFLQASLPESGEFFLNPSVFTIEAVSSSVEQQNDRLRMVGNQVNLLKKEPS